MLDTQLGRLLVFLDSPTIPDTAIRLVDEAVTPQQQLALALPLRHQQSGWSKDSQKRYFSFLGSAAKWRGGFSLSKYIEQTGEDALQHVTTDARKEMSSLLKPANSGDDSAVDARPFVREWTLSELSKMNAAVIANGDASAGRRLFAEAQCFACHRFRGEGGGVGPDLTAVAGRMNARDLLEAIVDPNRVISDQFAASTILTTDGRVITGRVVNLSRGAFSIQTNMLSPSELLRVSEEDIEDIRPGGCQQVYLTRLHAAK